MNKKKMRSGCFKTRMARNVGFEEEDSRMVFMNRKISSNEDVMRPSSCPPSPPPIGHMPISRSSIHDPKSMSRQFIYRNCKRRNKRMRSCEASVSFWFGSWCVCCRSYGVLCPGVIAADLLEANVICILAEATTAHVEAILTDHTVSVVADTAGGKEKREREK